MASKPEEIEAIFDGIEVVADNSTVFVTFTYKGKPVTSVGSDWNAMHSDSFCIRNIKGIIPFTVYKH